MYMCVWYVTVMCCVSVLCVIVCVWWWLRLCVCVLGCLMCVCVCLMCCVAGAIVAGYIVCDIENNIDVSSKMWCNCWICDLRWYVSNFIYVRNYVSEMVVTCVYVGWIGSLPVCDYICVAYWVCVYVCDVSVLRMLWVCQMYMLSECCMRHAIVLDYMLHVLCGTFICRLCISSYMCTLHIFEK